MGLGDGGNGAGDEGSGSGSLEPRFPRAVPKDSGGPRPGEAVTEGHPLPGRQRRWLQMEKMLVGCLLLLLGEVFLLFPVAARERPHARSLSRGRHARTHPQTALLESSCENKRADLVFIIDSSRSVNTQDYAKVKEFIMDILQFLDIGPDVTRVGLLQYGSTVKNEFSLKTFKRKSEVERAVKRMRHLSTGTMTGLAIQYALNIAFSEAEGARPLRENVPRVIMIVTDGRPQDSVAEVAEKARNTGILIFAIGVGQVDLNTLKAIGSEPHEDHVFLVANFSQIESLTSVFQNKLCTVHMCSLLEHNCAHFCINTPGSYVCRCKQGYILNPDQKTCRIQDLCATEDHACEQLCVNVPGSFVCQCYSGYTLAEDGKRCEAVDYCASENHGCEHECVNADSSYLCRCREGFSLNPDQKTCTKIDYCASPNHGCQHECVNTADSYSCRCLKGFILNPDKKTCRRINYCALSKPGCEHECVNTEESHHCRCHQGYILDPNGKTCSRVDHCAQQDHGCEQLCLNTEESFVCQCSEGFVINEDLKTCSRVDYCLLSNHGCEYSCINTDRSFACQCPEGHVLRSDGKTCARKDVCKSTHHGCEHICVNSGDSYICKCSEGFVLAEDGRHCRRCTEGPIDLVFVIDGSKSLGEENFEIVKQFVTGIIDSLAVSPKAARVGLLQYSTQVRTEFTLRNFSSAKDMKKAVAQMKYMRKGSMTGLALKHMLERSFTQGEGARPLSMRVPRVAIVFTDGRAQDDVSEWASKAKANGITIYAVGVGKAIEEELQEIASEPTDKHLFYAEDFSTMGEISEKLKQGICKALEDSDGRQDSPTRELPKRVHQPTESEPITINIRDLLSCSNFAVQHRYLFEEDNFSRSTQKLFHSTKSSGSPLEEKQDQCKCENLIMFQNLANEEVRKLTQRLEEMTQRMEALENRLRYR
ncbi:matrilin-2 isoform X12 [Castor canadensis]|uniref:Matrilin-2 isoform X12 n=1 Tax=Castor canadensis TaxID=51338 RepID=A0AC58M6H6_CASCN